MIMQLQAAEFQQLLGASLQEVAAANFNRKLLSAVKVDGTALSALLSSSDISRLLDALVEETFRDGQALVEEGITGDAFYIVTSGTATVSTRVKGELTVIGAGEHFGEMALVRAEPRAATVTAQGPLKALVLSRITFTRLLGPLQARLALEMDPDPNPSPNLHPNLHPNHHPPPSPSPSPLTAHHSPFTLTLTRRSASPAMAPRSRSAPSPQCSR